ncbi:MAG: DUF115 domain-containing protein [Treponema sp.]|nr:DUF115 domain-containing protein [Treponema sp.]
MPSLENYLEKNKKVLLNHYPGLWEDLLNNNDNFLPDDIKIENTNTGDPSFSIKGLQVHSLRDPKREVQRLIDAVSCEDAPIVILGFGLGYSAEAAAALNKPIIIIDKYKSLFLKALELRDFSDFFSKNKLIFVIGGSGEGIINALIIALKLKSGSSENDDKRIPPSIIRNRTIIGLDEQWYKSLEDKIRTWVMKDDVNTATHKRFGRRWMSNLSRNKSAIRDYPGVLHLQGLAEGEKDPKENPLPVFLAAAGPSLDVIKPILNDIYERCFIVAVDTSFRFFVKNGIQPDFVLVVDPQFWNSRHLDRCLSVPENESLMNSQTALIAESAVYPPVLNLPFKNKFLCSSLFPLGAFLEKKIEQKGKLGAGGSVATTAWDFARFLGGQEIWIAGLDLAFPGLKTHFKGARFEEKSNSESSRFNPAEKWIVRALRDGFPFKALSGNGGLVLTDRRLSLYAAWFENQFHQYAFIQNYSLSPEGLAISGLKYAETHRILELPKRREEINRRLQAVFHKIDTEFNAPQEKEKRTELYNNTVSDLRNKLKSIKEAAEEGAEITRRVLRYPIKHSQQNNVLKELDKVMQKITESEVKEIAGFLFPAEEENEKINNGQVDNDPFLLYLKSSHKLFPGLSQELIL